MAREANKVPRSIPKSDRAAKSIFRPRSPGTAVDLPRLKASSQPRRLNLSIILYPSVGMPAPYITRNHTASPDGLGRGRGTCPRLPLRSCLCQGPLGCFPWPSCAAGHLFGGLRPQKSAPANGPVKQHHFEMSGGIQPEAVCLDRGAGRRLLSFQRLPALI